MANRARDHSNKDPSRYRETGFTDHESSTITTASLLADVNVTKNKDFASLPSRKRGRDTTTNGNDIAVRKNRRVDGNDRHGLRMGEKFEIKNKDSLTGQNSTHKDIFQMMLLPLELQEQIFGYMNPITSVCAGITCRWLYDIHWKIHGPVALLIRPDHRKLGYLSTLLEEWMRRQGLTFRWGKFYSWEAYEERMQRTEDFNNKKRLKKKRRKAWNNELKRLGLWKMDIWSQKGKKWI